MNCPNCRYILSDLDAECPRCKNLQAQQANAVSPDSKSSSRSGPVINNGDLSSTIVADKLDVAGTTSGTSTPTTQASALVPTHTILSTLSTTTPLDCRCIICKSDNVQRVPAIVKSGKWSAESNWNGRSQWSELSKINATSNVTAGAYTFGSDTYTQATARIRAQGTTTTSGQGGAEGHEASSGTSDLAKLFEPPMLRLSGQAPQVTVDPDPQIQSSISCGFLWLTIFIALALGMLCLTFNVIGLAMILTITTPILLLVFNNWKSKKAAKQLMNDPQYQKERDRRKKEYELKLVAFEQKQEKQRRSYEKAMQRWNDLFYCHRCDHVFIPRTNQAVRAENMHRLLNA